jgi:hypothetical protein
LQEHRLLAAVIAKNAVGSSWQNIVDGRELSSVTAEEKAAVRQKALSRLLVDPSTAVATQVWHTINELIRSQVHICILIYSFGTGDIRFLKLIL